MNHRRRTAAGLLALFLSAAAPATRAQQSCPASAALPKTAGQNIFSPEQEIDLGDAIAESLQRDVRVIDDEDVTGFISAMANRMAAKLSSVPTKFRTFLLDSSEVNAFSVTGGRIYVTRKMVAFLHSDDELAALLGHEMGHILSRGLSATTTEQLREILGVTQVTDRKDIFAKFNLLLDNFARHPEVLEREAKRDEPDQYQADQIGMIAAAQSGYRAESAVELFDRTAGTHGKTGNWLFDLFGAPRDQRRLRMMHRALAELPPGCLTRRDSVPTQDFLNWQSAVAVYSGLNRREVLGAGAVKQELSPPLRTRIRRLKYSPNGRYVLAQDDAGIFVLSREPFQTLFRIPAEDAESASFSPDSDFVVFQTNGLRVEKWSIADQKQSERTEMFLQKGCLLTALSPDGKTLACYEPGRILELFEVKTGTAYFKHKYYHMEGDRLGDYLEYLGETSGILGLIPVRIQYSPDGRYLLAARRKESIAFDLISRIAVRVHGALQEGLTGPFEFVGPGEILRLLVDGGKPSDVLRFPSGETITTVDKKDRWLTLKQSPLVDVREKSYLQELDSGAIGEFNLDSSKMLRSAVPPPSLLGAIRNASASADLRWLALTQSSRGAIWDLTTGTRKYQVKGFRGGYFDADQTFYAEFPKQDQQPRMIARISLSNSDISLASEVPEKDSTGYPGRFWLAWKPVMEKKGSKADRYERILEGREVATGKLLWTRSFPVELPRLYTRCAPASATLLWGLSSEHATSILKRNDGLRARASTIESPAYSYLVEVLDPATGESRGYLPVDTGKGSFSLQLTYSVGDFVVAADSNNRVRLYSLSSGKLLATYFGANSTISADARFLSVENEPGQLVVYDLKTLEKHASYTFGYAIAYAQFSEDGKRLLIITANQKAYLLDVSRDFQVR